MIYRFFLATLLLLPMLGFSQVVVTGRVVSHAGGNPIPNATISINNSTIGTSADADGKFMLPGIKTGQYDLIVSCIGFELYYQRLTVNNNDVNLPLIEMTVKTTQLKEVKIRGNDGNRAQYLAMFTRAFLGRTANAQQCKIINPDVIDLQYTSSTRVLKASSDEDIIIENKALGYKIHYQLVEFMKNNVSGYQFYSGPVQFIEMSGSSSQQRQWAKNRLAVYMGSCMHFLRTVIAHNFAREGFTTFKLIRKSNPDRPSDEFLQAKIRHFATEPAKYPGGRDSINYYNDKYRLPKTMDYLSRAPLTEDQFAKPAEDNLYGLQFPDLLYIVYHGNAAHTIADPNHPPSTVLIPNTQIALFDNNGIFTDPGSIIYDGAWGFSGVADMLPIDYMPLGQ